MLQSDGSHEAHFSSSIVRILWIPSLLQSDEVSELTLFTQLNRNLWEIISWKKGAGKNYVLELWAATGLAESGHARTLII